jgi:aminopeptidase YwaD
MQHVIALARDIGPRPAGELDELRAAEYIRQQLSGYGYQAELQEFQFNDTKEQVTLAISSSQAASYSANALAESGRGQIIAEVVAAGIGRPQDFPSDGLQGRIAIMERGELTFSDKVANALSAGARGAIIYNNQPGRFSGALFEEVTIPVVAVSREDGQQLLNLASQGRVTATLNVAIKMTTSTSRNVIGRPSDGNCEIVVGGHYDSVPIAPGGNDNASGTAAVLEIARVAAAKGQNDDTCFMAFGAEEIGLLGSMHFVDTLTQDQRQRLRGMINLDVVGTGNRWTLIGSQALVELADQGAQDLGIEVEAGNLPPGSSSDHFSFISAGIPAVFITIFGHPPIHTPQDTADIIQPELLAQAAEMGLYVLERLVSGS